MGIARPIKLTKKKKPNPIFAWKMRMGFHITIGKFKHIQNIDNIL
jgi:hypothetical protein